MVELNLLFVRVLWASPIGSTNNCSRHPLPPHVLDITERNDDGIDHMSAIGINLQIWLALRLYDTDVARIKSGNFGM
jgi:hypothetical protein